jgi:hypothetical protein
MSLLLTERAVELANNAAYETMYCREALEAFLRYHATEGRETLVGQVALALRHGNAHDGSDLDYAVDMDAESVVTALFGEAASHEDA